MTESTSTSTCSRSQCVSYLKSQLSQTGTDQTEQSPGSSLPERIKKFTLDDFWKFFREIYLPKTYSEKDIQEAFMASIEGRARSLTVVPESLTPQINNQLIKDAVKYLKDHLKEEGVELKSSHAHSLVIGFLGYNSRSALNKALHRPESPFRSCGVTQRIFGSSLPQEMQKRLCDMGLSGYSVSKLEKLIYKALTPPCEKCGQRHDLIRGTFVMAATKEGLPEGWICWECQKSSEEYATCQVCEEGLNLFHQDQINQNGECPKHAGHGIQVFNDVVARAAREELWASQWLFGV